MSRYELLYIIPATYAETELQPVIDAITKQLTELGCTISRNEMVGKIKLTYPVNHVRYGYYILVDLDLEAAKIKAVNDMLRLHSEVLRHSFMVKDQKAKPVFKLQAMEEIDRDAPRRSESTDRAERETRQRQAAGAAKPADKKVEVDMADVEKSIDKILEGKIV
ncbi:MAG TPA: 30S ribosomal protein S6 [Candidatus Baltobacteraceae bacterium]|jgi:ribosomal protein S6|nr:30S ribosomal protein S6 [Candidatus Baltobacteraceae bacterium]